MFGDKKLQLPNQRTITRPGNVRELQNVLKRIMILGEGEETIDDLLNTSVRQQRGPEFQATGTKPSIPVDLWGLNGDKAPNLSSLSLKKVRKKTRDRVEREVISYVLGETFWNRTKAAKILDISYKTLLEKIKGLDIKPLESDNHIF
jgi:DNA-binding NtrC family response regulator